MLSAATVFTVCSGMYKTVFFSCQGLLYSLYVQICTKHNGANKMQHIDLNKNVLLFSLLLCRRLLLYSLHVQICTKHSVVYTKNSIVQSSFMPQAIAVFIVCSDLYQTQCYPVFFHAVGRCCIHCAFRSVLNTVLFNLISCHRPLLYSLYVQICTEHSVVQSSFYAVGRYCIHCMFRSVLNTVLLIPNTVLFSLLFMSQAFTVLTVCSELCKTQWCQHG